MVDKPLHGIVFTGGAEIDASSLKLSNVSRISRENTLEFSSGASPLRYPGELLYVGIACVTPTASA